MYAPPAMAAEVAVREDRHAFQPVGKAKFFTLYLLTFGMYHIVWFYLHWANFKAARKEPMWPVARSLFSIFFTHALASEIDETITRRDVRHAWAPKTVATTVVLLSLFLWVMGRAPSDVIPDAIAIPLGLVALVPLAIACWNIQHAANLACGDPKGETNARFSWANWIWMVLFGAFMLFVLLGAVLIVAEAFIG